jgi:hypothetical protein
MDANTDAAESKGADSEGINGLSGGLISASDGPSSGGVGGSSRESVRTPEETKELLERQARDGQWFKFNDETVVKVRPFEAINHCFGRNKTNLGFGSAYMLVYIRESNASEIMAKVTQRDIPPCLTNRLDSIMVQRAEEERKILQAKTFRTIKYATEEHVRDFHGYRLEIDVHMSPVLSS